MVVVGVWSWSQIFECLVISIHPQIIFVSYLGIGSRKLQTQFYTKGVRSVTKWPSSSPYFILLQYQQSIWIWLFKKIYKSNLMVINSSSLDLDNSSQFQLKILYKKNNLIYFLVKHIHSNMFPLCYSFWPF